MNNKEAEFGIPSIGIPAEVLFNPELSRIEKMLFGFLRNLSKSSKGCWASNRYLGYLNGVTPQTVSNAISKLKKWRYIDVKYSTSTGGQQIRNIFISTEYPKLYKKLVAEWHDNIKNKSFVDNRTFKSNKLTPKKIKRALSRGNIPLKQESNPPLIGDIPPYKKTRSKEVIENVNYNVIYNPLPSFTNFEEEENILNISEQNFSLDSFCPDEKVEIFHFDIFWKIYPRKVDKGKAKTVWEILALKSNRPAISDIIAAVTAQIESSRWGTKAYIPYPANWIREQGWLNDPDEMVDFSKRESKNSIPIQPL